MHVSIAHVASRTADVEVGVMTCMPLVSADTSDFTTHSAKQKCMVHVIDQRHTKVLADITALSLV